MTNPTDPLAAALLFHETYERLAPSFGYETRTDTREFDPTTPNGRLMVAVCGEVVQRVLADAVLAKAEREQADLNLALAAEVERLKHLADNERRWAEGRDKDVADLVAERDKLQAYKDWTHQYLDGKGVPHHPPGTHGAAGCRIGDWMDYVFAEVERLKEQKQDETYLRGNQLAAISSILMADTPVSLAATRIPSDHALYTAAFQDAVRTVEKVISLREQLAALAAAPPGDGTIDPHETCWGDEPRPTPPWRKADTDSPAGSG